MLFGDGWMRDVWLRSCRCLICLPPSSVGSDVDLFGIAASGISCPLTLIFHDVVVYHPKCRSVVCLHWCGWLFVSEEVEGVSGRDGFFAVDV